MSKLKKSKYIKVKTINQLNTEKIPQKSSDEVEENCESRLAESCDHNINNKYKKEYINNITKKGIEPYWLNHPEVCKIDPASKEEQEEMENLLKEFK
ncbi:MAG: hypothetical protein Q4G04_05370 [bacterium]|nr:hypothetical protein [bacterium]